MQAFGLNIDFRACSPPGRWASSTPAGPALKVEIVEQSEIQEIWSGASAIGWEARIDGAPFVVEVGRAGDHRFLHGESERDRDVHHLSPDRRLLRCAPQHPDQPLWWRIVLDSVLFTASLLSGHEAMHCGAVVAEGRALALAAASGGGKSTLVAEMIGRGLPLLSDDVLVLEARREGAPLAYPGAPLMTVPTVPGGDVALGSPRRTAELGTTIATVEDERWIAVPAHGEPVPLAGFVVLDRRPAETSARRQQQPEHAKHLARPPTGAPTTTLERVKMPFGALMGALMHFPRTPQRERARFELATSLAAHTAVWRLSAPSHVDPAALADLALQTVSEPDAAVDEQARTATLP